MIKYREMINEENKKIVKCTEDINANSSEQFSYDYRVELPCDYCTQYNEKSRLILDTFVCPDCLFFKNFSFRWVFDRKYRNISITDAKGTMKKKPILKFICGWSDTDWDLMKERYPELDASKWDWNYDYMDEFNKTHKREIKRYKTLIDSINLEVPKWSLPFVIKYRNRVNDFLLVHISSLDVCKLISCYLTLDYLEK